MPISHIPLWVFPLFLGLAWLGYRLSHDRMVKPGGQVAAALGMCAFSLYGIVSAFGAAVWPLAAWASGYLLALWWGAAVLGRAGLYREGGRVHLPGSWAPMGLMMGIFAVKFMLGFAKGVGSPLLADAGVVSAAALCLGLCSGGFGARALAVRRVAGRSLSARQTRGPAPASAPTAAH